MLRRTFLASAAVRSLAGAVQSISNLTAEGAVNNPYGLTIGPDGALYICEVGNSRISRFDLQASRLATVVDNQKEPYEVRFGPDRNLYFVDMPANQVKCLNYKTGILSVVAGTGSRGFSGDGGQAGRATLNQPHSIAFDPEGRLLVCDIGNHRIRQIDLASGMISTFAGTGEAAGIQPGATRQTAALWGPRAIDFDTNKDLLIVLREGNAVWRWQKAGNRFERVAGTGEKGYAGDGSDARKARLSGPKGISCARDGSIFIADTENHAIRKIDAGGLITTVAGTGQKGDGPTGDPLRCQLSRPHGVLAAVDGTLYIADSEANRVRIFR